MWGKKKSTSEEQTTEEIKEAQTDEQNGEEEAPKAARTPKFTHTIRVIAGAYLIYMGYGLFKDRFANGNTEINIWLLLAAGLFIVFGAFFLFTSGKELLNISKEEKAAAKEIKEQAEKEANQGRMSIKERARLAQMEAAGEESGEEPETVAAVEAEVTEEVAADPETQKEADDKTTL